MRKTLSLLALVMFAITAHAQITDSLILLLWQSDLGERPSFDLPGYNGNRFDANGDGVSELITVELNENNVATQLNIYSILLDSMLWVVDLGEVRSNIFADGFESGDVAALKFEGFLHWAPRDTGIPVDPILMSANGGPIIIDPNGLTIGMPPSDFKLFTVTDFDDDGWPEIMVGNKEERRVQLYGSKLAPGNQ